MSWMMRIPSLRSAASNRRRGRRWKAGGVAVEGALLAPIILTMAAGVADYGVSVQDKMRLVGAVGVGTQYALTDATDVTAIQQAVIATLTAAGEADAADTVTVTVSLTCECPGTGAADCADVCETGTMRQHVTVVAERPHQWMVDYPLMENPTTLRAEATIRVR